MLVHILTDVQHGNTPESTPDLSHVLFVGTYRPNEVSETHALHQAVDEIKTKNSTGVVELGLQALSLEDVERFVAETFQGELEAVGTSLAILNPPAPTEEYNVNNADTSNISSNPKSLSTSTSTIMFNYSSHSSNFSSSNESRESVNAVVALASILFAKTMGNPYFVNQMIHSMYQDGFIYYINPTQKNAMSYVNSFNDEEDNGDDNEDVERDTHDADEDDEDEYISSVGVWECNLEKIANAHYASNVVDLLVNKLQSMEKQTQILIGVAAIAGGLFELNLVTVGSSFIVKETKGWEEWAALQLEKENFIIRVMGHEAQEDDKGYSRGFFYSFFFFNTVFYSLFNFYKL